MWILKWSRAMSHRFNGERFKYGILRYQWRIYIKSLPRYFHSKLHAQSDILKGLCDAVTLLSLVPDVQSKPYVVLHEYYIFFHKCSELYMQLQRKLSKVWNILEQNMEFITWYSLPWFFHKLFQKKIERFPFVLIFVAIFHFRFISTN